MWLGLGEVEHVLWKQKNHSPEEIATTIILEIILWLLWLCGCYCDFERGQIGWELFPTGPDNNILLPSAYNSEEDGLDSIPTCTK